MTIPVEPKPDSETNDLRDRSGVNAPIDPVGVSAEAPAPDFHSRDCVLPSDGRAEGLVKASELFALAAERDRLKVENIQMQAALGYGILADYERHIIPSNPFTCGTCGPKDDEITRLTAEIASLKAELADALTDLNTARQDNASFGPEFKRLKAEVERLRSIILNIHAGRYEARETVTPENAFEAYGRLNKKIIAIYEQCRAALKEPAHD